MALRGRAQYPARELRHAAGVLLGVVVPDPRIGTPQDL